MLSRHSTTELYPAPQEGFSNEPAPTLALLWLPSALRTKPDLYLAFKAPLTQPLIRPPHQGIKTCQSTPQTNQSLSLTSTPPPCLCRSHPSVWNALPPPWPGKSSPQGSGVGAEAVSWWGRWGPQPSPASAGPLPSFPGSSLGPHPTPRSLTFLGWLWSPFLSSSLCLLPGFTSSK